MTETWKDIEGYEGCYQISSHGRVKSLQRFKICGRGGRQLVRERILKQTVTHKGKGYCMVIFCKDGIVKYKTVHRLVALAFIENLEDKPQINHKNGIKTDNRISNLEWCYPIDNIRHARKNGRIHNARGVQVGTAKLIEESVLAIIRRINAGEIQRSLAREYDVSEATISLIKTRQIWKHVK